MLTNNNSHKLLVIGGGIAGYSCALRAAHHGIDVALVEERELGGTCLNRGCIPTKAYLHLVEQYKGKAISSDNAKKDIALGIEQIVTGLRNGLEYSLDCSKVHIYHGKAYAGGGQKAIIVRGDNLQTEIEFEKLLIATGSQPGVPSGIQVGGHILTTDTIFEYENIAPDRIAIVGGGVIGIEFASFLADLGCDVTVIESLDRILIGLSEDLSLAIYKHLIKKHVNIITDSRVEFLSEEDGEVYVQLSDKAGHVNKFLVDKALVATGRRSNLDEDFAGYYGIKIENGCIKTNGQLLTSNPDIYAAGDVSNQIQLAYVAAAEGEAVADLIAGKKISVMGAIPKCIFMDIDAAVVGDDEDTLKIKGKEYDTVKISLKSNSMAFLQGNTEGYCKILVEKGSNVLLGVELFCPHAVDMIELCKNFIDHKETIEKIAGMVFPHPSYIEVIRTAAMELLNRQRTKGEIK